MGCCSCRGYVNRFERWQVNATVYLQQKPSIHNKTSKYYWTNLRVQQAYNQYFSINNGSYVYLYMSKRRFEPEEIADLILCGVFWCGDLVSPLCFCVCQNRFQPQQADVYTKTSLQTCWNGSKWMVMLPRFWWWVDKTSVVAGLRIQFEDVNESSSFLN